MRTESWCLNSQPLGHRAVEVACPHPQFVGEALGGGVEVGEMVAPALDLAADRGGGVGGRVGGGGAGADPVIGAREGLGTARRARQPFLDLHSIDLEIGEHRIGQPPPDRLGAAAGFACGERARIEIERLGQPQQHGGGQGALIALDEVEIGGRDMEHLGHRRLRQSRAPAEAADGMTGEELGIDH